MQKKQLSIVTKNSLSLSLRTQALHVLQFPIARMKVNNCEAQRWFHLISKCDMLDKPGKASVHKKKLVSFKEQLAIADRYKQTLPCSHAQNTLSSRKKSLSLSLRTQALHVLQFPQRRWSDQTPFAVTTAKPRKGCITSLANLTYMLHAAGQVEVYSISGSQEEQGDNVDNESSYKKSVWLSLSWSLRAQALKVALNGFAIGTTADDLPARGLWITCCCTNCKDGFASLANLTCWRSRSLNSLKLAKITTGGKLSSEMTWTIISRRNKKWPIHQ